MNTNEITHFSIVHILRFFRGHHVLELSEHIGEVDVLKHISIVGHLLEV